ncbi:GntR family transcriptional regulator [Erwinia sp. E602]|uniref:GntR family transcriptional regulator n=1 Tax=unclassified Erwinia TaxID=2622719 RepID=UPI00070074D1|nr:MULTISPECIES: GntR family transcriptional regulator [unclassified Erwinia]KQN56577.1 hypothetical protein ASF13_05500 [Erwinia sp. Leaf53]PLV61334.1 hypothetical protein NV64_09320 [Erwinia sp. B116]QUG76206.1 GntR family transcriptional regulator [Erwinia sp. E602]
MDINPVTPRVTLRTEVGERLRQAIIERQLAPGSKLTESRLAQEFGVSRAPMREAISALVEEGLLVAKPYAGYYVQSLNEQSLRDLYDMRRVLETFAFELVWPKRDEAFRAALHQRHEALLQILLQDDKFAAIKAELHLHGTAFDFCGNELLVSTWRSLSGRLQLYWSLHQDIHGRKGARLDAHESYVALACGDDWQAMREDIAEHVYRGVEKVVESVKIHQGLIAPAKRT